MFKKIKDFFQQLAVLRKIGGKVFKDPVTGLYNRCYFKEAAGREWAQSQRYNYKLAFVMIDVNNFKRINDEFGHDTGDKVLKKIGQLLEEKTRESDLVARWGGDEFVLLLSHTDPKSAQVLLKRICNDFNNYMKEKGFGTKTSLSYGVESWDVDNLVQVSKRADRKMYYYKDKVKNGN